MIGVLGGTFDPIHFGHLRPALDVLQGLGLQEIRFIPLSVAVHRDQPTASNEQRLAMVRAALNTQPGFVADDRELGRVGGSYSFDTLTSLRAEKGETIPIVLLIGADAFRGFRNWHLPDGILELAHLVVMQRPGFRAALDPELKRWIFPRLTTDARDLEKTGGGRILFQEVTQLDISATLVRHLIAGGKSPRFLLPDAVLSIIEREGLYVHRSGGRGHRKIADWSVFRVLRRGCDYRSSRILNGLQV
jgi:nicotinate-nucleotide adenylyltransferase